MTASGAVWRAYFPPVVARATRISRRVLGAFLPVREQAHSRAMNDSPNSALIAFAGRLADAARAVVAPYFQRPIDVAYKGDASPVTEADRAVETRLRDMIAEQYPSHGVVGEELDNVGEDAEHVWVLDPIDGTQLFIGGIPLFTTLIALTRGGVPVLGVIDQPISGDRWLGAAGRPTTFNGAPVRTRPCARLADALICTSNPAYYEGADKAAFERLRDAVNWTQYGVDSYGFGLVASGFIDLGIETVVHPHDFCPILPVIEGAGGVMTDWEGRPLTLTSGPRMLAAGDPAAHAAALALLAG